MGKRIFWIFILVVTVCTTAAVMYIQSEGFARIAKVRIQQTVARDLGLELNFDRLQVGVLPPSLSLVNVDVKVSQKSNALGLSMDTVLKAGRLGFSFRMIQAFSRGIAVNKVFLSDGDIQLLIPKSKNDEPSEKLSELVHQAIRIPLGDGFTASIRQLEVRTTKLHLSWWEPKGFARLQIGDVTYLAVTPTSSGTNLVANLENLEIETGTLKEKAKTLKVNADIQKNLIELSTLDLQRRDAAVHAAGKFVGSIDDVNNLRPDVDLILRTPLTELADFDKSFDKFQGELLADVKLVGRVREPAFQGKIELNNFRHGLWDFDKLQVAGSYGAGMLTVDSASVNKAGGKIALKNKLELAIPFTPEPRAFQLQLSKVEFAEFAGDLKKSVNNLRMNLDGMVGLRLDFSGGAKPKLAGIGIRPELTVRELELNNQTYGKPRAYKRIFRVEPFQLVGAIQWRDGEVRVNEGRLVFPSGTVEARGTVSDGKGFDLYGTAESLDLGREVGSISGIPISGVGPAKLHVHGPSEAVLLDFDINHRDAKFVNFDFGEVAGRVTYDDGKSYLYLTGIKGKKNSSRYEVEGKVNVGDGDDISLDAVFSESDPNDLFAIFAKQLEKLTWIPRGMTGTIEGRAKVGGGYSRDLETLDITGNIKGKNLAYMGEMLHELDANASLRGGVLSAKTLRARKYEALFQGEIEYKLSGEMKYLLEANKAKLRSLDFISSAGLPLDGLFSLRSQGQGKWETLVSNTKIDMRNAFVRTRAVPPLEMMYNTFADHSEYQVRLGENAEISGRLAQNLNSESSATVRMENANFDFFFCALSRRSCADPALNFNVSANAALKWKGKNWQAMSGEGLIKDFSVAKTGYHLRSPKPIPLAAANGVLEAEKFLLEGEQSKLYVKATGRVDGTGIDSQVQGDASLKLLEFLTPLIEESRGKMGVTLALTGSVSDAHFRGNLDLQDGFLRLGGLDAPVDSLNGRIRLQGSSVNLDSVTGQMGGGSVQASGSMDVYLDRAPRFDLDLFLANNRVKFFPVTYAEISDAKLSLTGQKPPYLFGGTVRMKRVLMRNNFDLAGGKGIQNARYLPEKVGGAKSFYEIRIKAIADGGIFVENALLNAEFKGEATLLNNFEFPQVVARAELVRGKLLFRNTAFTLDHAYIRAPNPEYFNPQFSVGGVTDVDSYRISIFASGTIEKPKISLTSYPSIPQEDIVSLLAFGYRGEDARKVKSDDTSAITYSEVGAILLEQLQLNQNLQSKGLRVSVMPSLNESEANIISPKSNQTAAPKVYLQTQILKNLDAAFGGTLGSARGQSVDAKLEYRVGRKASLSAVYEQMPVGLDATETRSSYGADLKFRWGFK